MLYPLIFPVSVSASMVPKVETMMATAITSFPAPGKIARNVAVPAVTQATRDQSIAFDDCILYP